MVDFVQRSEKETGRRLGVRQAMLKLAEICGLTDYETERPVKGRAKRGSSQNLFEIVR